MSGRMNWDRVHREDRARYGTHQSAGVERPKPRQPSRTRPARGKPVRTKTAQRHDIKASIPIMRSECQSRPWGMGMSSGARARRKQREQIRSLQEEVELLKRQLAQATVNTSGEDGRTSPPPASSVIPAPRESDCAYCEDGKYRPIAVLNMPSGERPESARQDERCPECGYCRNAPGHLIACAEAPSGAATR